MSPEPAALRRTPLYESHVAAGAKLVPFAGFEMPLQYAGISAEHLAVRNAVGVFDVSHMGQVRTHGPQALEALQRLVSNDVRRIPVGGAQYSLLCRRGRRCDRRPLHLSARRLRFPDGHQRLQP